MALITPATPPVLPKKKVGLIPCSVCDGTISKRAETCPHCGHRHYKGNADLLAGVLLVLMIVGLIGFFAAWLMNLT